MPSVAEVLSLRNFHPCSIDDIDQAFTARRFLDDSVDCYTYHRCLGPASGRVNLPQQPQENVAFIRPQPDPRIHHLDDLNILPLRIPEKRKRTRRPHRPEEIRLRALRLVGQVEVVHRRQIELHTALRFKHVKCQPVRLHFFHRRQIKLRINAARALHSIRELINDTRTQLSRIKIRQRGCVFAVHANTQVRRNRLVRQFCLALCLPPSLHPNNPSGAKRKSRIDNPPSRSPNPRHYASAHPVRPHRLPGTDSLSSQSATPNAFSDFPALQIPGTSLAVRTAPALAKAAAASARARSIPGKLQSTPHSIVKIAATPPLAVFAMTLSFVPPVAAQPIALVMAHSAVPPRPVQEMTDSAAAPALPLRTSQIQRGSF